MRRRHRRMTANADLDITAFMNLMIILVPVLLLGMVFSQMRMIELDFPGMPSGQAPEPDSFRLEVVLATSGIVIADSDRGIIRSLPAEGKVLAFEQMRDTLERIKRSMPGKTDLVLRVTPEVSYQTLVTTLDHIRSSPQVVAANVVEGELFPDVSLADAPEDYQVTASQTGSEGSS